MPQAKRAGVGERSVVGRNRQLVERDATAFTQRLNGHAERGVGHGAAEIDSQPRQLQIGWPALLNDMREQRGDGRAVQCVGRPGAARAVGREVAPVVLQAKQRVAHIAVPLMGRAARDGPLADRLGY